MMRLYKKLITVLLVFVIAVPYIILPADAETTTDAKIHSLVPKAEQYYTGIEDYIAQALRDKKSKIDVSQFGISSYNIPKVFKSAVFTNPDIFYVDASEINYKYDTSADVVYYIYPTYLMAKSKIPSYIKKFEKAVNSFMNDIDENLSDFKKALLIHDKLITECAYKSSSDIAYTAYGALVKHKAVCEGYSRAYCYLLSKAGIESKCINNASKAHCWNYIKLGGKWYHVDVTSDDPTPDTCGYVSHKYFLINDSKLSSYKSSNHTGYKSDITYKSTYKCSSSTYNLSFFRKIKSQIIIYNKCYFFINNNYNSKYYSAFIKRKDGKNKVVKIIKDVWYSNSGVYYKGSYSKLSYLDGFIYFNSKREIYRYKIKTGKLKQIFVMPSFWSKDFYGVKTSGRYILSNKKKSTSASASKVKTLYIRSDQSVIQLPFIKYSSVSLKKKDKYTFKIYRGSGKATFKTSNKKVATVTSSGVVKAIKKGSCTITAVKNSRTFKLKVKVY